MKDNKLLRIGVIGAISAALCCFTPILVILFAHLLGPRAEEQIDLFAMAMAAGLTANRIKGLIFAYPSFASDIGEMM